MMKVISTRLDPLMIAKARDGLKLKGYGMEELISVSNIVRLTFFYGLAELLNDINIQTSEDSILWVNQKIGQRQSKKTLDLNDLK